MKCFMNCAHGFAHAGPKCGKIKNYLTKICHAGKLKLSTFIVNCQKCNFTNR